MQSSEDKFMKIISPEILSISEIKECLGTEVFTVYSQAPLKAG
jgi:hypothetical protein